MASRQCDRPDTGRSHSFVECPLASDPGLQLNAPFFDAPHSDRRALQPMNDLSFASSGCPPVDVYGSSDFGDAQWRPSVCLPASPSMQCFFGEGSYDPPIVTSRPLEPMPKHAMR